MIRHLDAAFGERLGEALEPLARAVVETVLRAEEPDLPVSLFDDRAADFTARAPVRDADHGIDRSAVCIHDFNDRDSGSIQHGARRVRMLQPRDDHARGPP